MRVPHKPAAPSVRGTLAPAIERSRKLAYTPEAERPMSPREVAEDVIRKLDLRGPISARLRELHGIGRRKGLAKSED